MFKPPRLGQAVASIVLAIGLAAAPSATAQDFALDVAKSDRFVRDGILPQGLVDLFDPSGGKLKGGLYFSAGIQAAYNSSPSVIFLRHVCIGIDPEILHRISQWNVIFF